MGIYLSQLPPAELALLKAELAEILIANFCYPRFYDYRTSSLRMRPVDRNKRQEVWLYLSSIDFTAWNRVDLLSPDFQYQIERLIIHFVQRNRSFFGEQGRKRMADVRMLINSCSSFVTEGLRGHLMGRSATNPPFGGPRPVSSWNATHVMGHAEPKWEQIVSNTMLLQQQLQEVRSEIKAPVTNVNRPVGTPAKRATRGRLAGNATNGKLENEVGPVQHVPVYKPEPQREGRTTGPLPGPKTTNPLTSPLSPIAAVVSVPVAPPVRKVDSAGKYPPFTPPEQNTVGAVLAPPSSALAPPSVLAPPSSGEEINVQAPPPATPAKVESRELAQATHTSQASVIEVPAKQPESSTVLVSEEDVVIFEQMRHQLVMWLRVEAVRSGAEISGQGPAELLELLNQQDGFDETGLQVASTLLTIADQVISSRHASLLDYKQAMMFYLMHTRRSR